jgi:hypothetical protein
MLAVLEHIRCSFEVACGYSSVPAMRQKWSDLFSVRFCSHEWNSIVFQDTRNL